MGKEAADKARDTAGHVADKAKDLAGQARETASNVVDKAKDMAGQAVDRAKEFASSGADKARDMANTAGQKATELTSRVGTGMESLGDTIREHAPSGTMGSMANRVADNLEHGGQFLRQEGLQGLGDEMSSMIKRNPIPSVFLGIALGYLLARATRS